MTLTGTTNTSANTALRYLGVNNMNASNSLAKLSSGSRIVKASDDAASLAVGTKIKADVTALKQAAVNAGQASSLLQVADGGMARTADILQRMKALSVQAQSGSVTNNERAFLDEEYQALLTQVGDIATQTKFNGSILLDGSNGKSATAAAGLGARGITAALSGNPAAGAWTLAYTVATGTFTLDGPAAGGDTHTVQIDTAAGLVYEGTINFESAGLSFNLSNFDDATALAATTVTVAGSGSMGFQVGVAASDTIAVSIDDVDATALGINGTSITTTGNATTASNALDTAISTVNSGRAGLGAVLSRFEFVSANLATTIENLDAARSTLMDVDMAAEMSSYTSSQVLMQASVAMLAQANQMPQNLLRLLQ